VVSITLLADQERLVKLCSGLAADPGITVQVVSDIDAVLTAPPNRGTRVIVIQERLGEVSGEIIAQRLADQLRGRKIQLVLLGSQTDLTTTGKQPTLTLLNPNLADGELATALRALVTTPPTESKKRQPARTKKPAAPVVAPLPEAVPPPLATETISDTVVLGASNSTATPTAPQQPGSEPVPARSSFAAKLDDALQSTTETAGTAAPAAVVSDRVVLSTPSPPARPAQPPPRHQHQQQQPAPAGRTKRSPTPKRLLLIGALTVGGISIALTLLQQYAKPGSTDSEKPAKTTLPPAAAGPLLTLPTFIPRLAPDAAYGTANPGWERYRTAALEFRVYRERGVIKAIQLFDRSGNGISGALFNGALTELSGSNNYLIERTERQGRYQVERGRLINGKGIIIYRTDSANNVTAVVFDVR
jgi:hypothetical protein